MEELLQRALEIAIEAHEGQTDKAGRPYIEHPLRVMAMGGCDEERIVGILHDVVEDSSWTLLQLKEEGFSDDILDAVDALTRRSDETYDRFIARVARNKLATAVKLSDLTDNMDIRQRFYLRISGDAVCTPYPVVSGLIRKFDFAVHQIKGGIFRQKDRRIDQPEIAV